MNYKKGDIVKITDCKYGHQFPIGSKVVIMGCDNYDVENPNYEVHLVGDPDDDWWIEEDEFEKIK